MSEFDACIDFPLGKPVFTCSFCKREMPIVTPNKLEVIACDCGKVHSRKDFDKYLKLNNNFRNPFYLIIGKEGVFEGKTYRVVGIANKVNKKNQFDKWTEYTLWCETDASFSFLNCAYGNYTWVWPTYEINALDFIQSTENRIKVGDEQYKLAFGYAYNTYNIIGAFPYNVVEVKDNECFDYISPPNIISLEKDNGVYNVFKGRYFKRKEIATIFDDFRIESQEKEGVGIAQPFYGNLNVRNFNIVFGLLLLFITLATIFQMGFYTTDIPLKKGILQTTLSSKDTVYVSSSFTLKPKSTPYYLELNDYANLNTEWLEMVTTLVNEKTGEEREVGMVSEYYSGVSDGYSWSEGSNFGSTNISGVEPGRYHLKMKLYNNFLGPKNVTYSLKATAPHPWNFYVLFFILSGFMGIINLMHRQFERMRSGEIDNLFGTS